MAAFLVDYCRQLAEVHNVRIDIGRISENLCTDNERVVQLYRIAQEAIANAAKHAQARRIEVSFDYLSAESMLIMSVSDDGIGIGPGSPRDGGLGMRMMAHRARMINAELQIGHNHPSGTLVRCTIRCAECSAACEKITDGVSAMTSNSAARVALNRRPPCRQAGIGLVAVPGRPSGSRRGRKPC